MAIPVADSIGLTGNALIDGLVQGGSWQFAAGNTLTYSLSINTEPDDPVWGNHAALAQAFAQALAAWSSVANLAFDVLADPGPDVRHSPADLAIVLANDPDFPFVGLGLFPDPDYVTNVILPLMDPHETRESYPHPEGDIQYNLAFGSFDNLSAGSFGFYVLMHEIGHALGLKHPIDDGGNSRPTFDMLGLGSFNNTSHTLMSVFGATPDALGNPATPMPLDILAMQRIYGANAAYRTGNDTYVLAVDGAMRTIWDAGGTDTLDASALSGGVTLDLRPGAVMNLSLNTVLGVAYADFLAGAVIENAIGGSGNDTIYGNDADNVLDGRAGIDTMSGGMGNDTYLLDNAQDLAIEGPNQGIDTVVASFTYGLDQPGRLDLENLTLTGSADINASGNQLANVLTGNSGANVLYGHMGVDTMIGGAGNDTYIVWESGDVIVENPAEGIDAVQSIVSYVLSANVESLVLDANAGSINGAGNTSGNTITGNAGVNILDGGAGADTMSGGGSDDTYIVDDPGDVLVESGSSGIDTVRASLSYQLGANLENLVLTGTANLQAYGNGLDNRLTGNSGNNLLDGGAGADAMSGGGGDDTYIMDSAGDAVAEGALSTALVSTTADGAPANGFSSTGVISDAGGHAAFVSSAANLVNGSGITQNVFVKNLQTGAVMLASGGLNGAGSNGASTFPDLSADGRYVAFESNASNLVAGDTNGWADVFVRDLQSGALQRVSTDSNGAQGNGSSGFPGISADGRYVIFQSSSSNLVPGGNSIQNIYLKDLQTGETRLVSNSASGVAANHFSDGAKISADGRYVVFRSAASNLLDNATDDNQAYDLFRKDLQTGAVVLVSSASDGTLSNDTGPNADIFRANGSSAGGISADGRYVAFNSLASNLTPGDDNGQIDVFVKDLQTGETRLVSTPSGGGLANNGSSGSGIASGGRYVVFGSIASNMAPGDSDSASDVFVKDLQTNATALISAPALGTKIGDSSSGYSISADGRSLVFQSTAANLVAGDANFQGDVFVSQNPLFDPGGADEVRSAVSYTLGPYLERLVLAGSGNLDGTGNALDNVLTGNSGDNALDGGGGTDAAVYSGLYRQYGVSGNPSVSATLTGPDGTDALSSIEELQFMDGTRHANGSWTIDATAGSVARLYWGTLDRAPDLGGLTFHVNAIKTGQVTLAQDAASFVGSAEFQAHYGALDNAQFVNQLYLNVLERPADAGGSAFWLNFLNTGGHTRGDVTLGFTDSAEYQAKMFSQIDQGVAASTAPVTGTNGDDVLPGSGFNDAIAGLGGNDTLYGYDPHGPHGEVDAISATRVASGLGQPLFAVSPPGDVGRLFVVEKNGLIKILDLATQQILPTPFLDLTGQIATDGEQGLLGLAFHPDYADNGLFYVNVINPSGDTEIRRYQVSAADPNQADAASAALVIAIDQPAGLTNHKAGWLDFGPDGYLYAALGDGGGGGDPGNNSQNIDSLLGKMLRLDVDSDAFPADAARNYGIPADNPFVGIPGADEIWALGLRNPWRPSFDRVLGDLYIADVGQDNWEEIDLGAPGANYGWRILEGNESYSPGAPGGGTLTAPIHVYGHDVGHSITGGYVYRGPGEGLQGDYFFADFSAGKVFTLHFDGDSWQATDRTSQIVPDSGAINSPSSFGQDGLGNLYVVDYDGDIFRLSPGAGAADGADVLDGMGGNDVLFAGSGNDTLTGGAGNDSINGGSGVDVAQYTGAFRQYLETGNAIASATVQGPEGTDTLTGVEKIAFVDGSLYFNPDAHIAQVERLYQATLDRLPDALGQNFWQAILDSGAGQAGLNVMADSFVGSAEFQSHYGALDNAQFVNQLYLNVLDRPADPGGLAFWSGQLDAGMTRGQVVTGFSESAEFIQNNAALYAAGLWDIDETAASVARLYLGALGRAPDVEGLKFHTNAIKSGQYTLAQDAGTFVASTEFQATYGSLDDPTFVNQLYLNVLNRPADPGGAAYWSGLLSGGYTRGAVTLEFTESQENQLQTIGQIDHGIAASDAHFP